MRVGKECHNVWPWYIVGRRRREAAILVEQALVSQRAMKHAAWGAKKDIRSKIKAVKKSPYSVNMRLPKRQVVTPPPATPVDKQRVGSQKTRPGSTGKQGGFGSPLVPQKTQPVVPPASKSATPVGFRKIRDPTRQSTTPTGRKASPTSRSTQDPLLWRIGEDYGELTDLAIYIGMFQRKSMAD